MRWRDRDRYLGVIDRAGSVAVEKRARTRVALTRRRDKQGVVDGARRTERHRAQKAALRPGGAGGERQGDEAYRQNRGGSLGRSREHGRQGKRPSHIVIHITLHRPRRPCSEFGLCRRSLRAKTFSIENYGDLRASDGTIDEVRRRARRPVVTVDYIEGVGRASASCSLPIAPVRG
jgi:hypothetical protein